MQINAFKRRRRARSRGQTTVESVIILMFLLLIFLGIAQLVDLYTAQLVNHHAANVAARSQSVGFHPDIVRRAALIGSIPMSGKMLDPLNLSPTTPTGASAAQLPSDSNPLVMQALQEPRYILMYMSDAGIEMDYERWDSIRTTSPALGGGDMATTHVKMSDFPLEMGMWDLIMSADSIDLESDARLLNHANLYLE